jgi:hypothetical protein
LTLSGLPQTLLEPLRVFRLPRVNARLDRTNGLAANPGQPIRELS